MANFIAHFLYKDRRRLQSENLQCPISATSRYLVDEGVYSAQPPGTYLNWFRGCGRSTFNNNGACFFEGLQHTLLQPRSDLSRLHTFITSKPRHITGVAHHRAKVLSPPLKQFGDRFCSTVYACKDDEGVFGDLHGKTRFGQVCMYFQIICSNL